MKRLLSVLLAAMMLVSVVGFSASAEEVTLTACVMDAVVASALEELAEDYRADHPDFELEVTVVSGVAEYYAAISAKIQAGDIPDIMVPQWSTQIQAYAKAGYLMPLEDTGIAERIHEIKKPLNAYGGHVYAYPLVHSFWCLLWNENLAAKYGVTEVPKCMDEWVASMETMRQNGLQYPYLVAGKDGSGATAFIFAYLHETTSGINPDFYYQTLTGEKSWKSDEIVEMMNEYARVLEYTPEDTLGMDIEEMRRRFCREEAVCLINGTGMIPTLREMNPDFDFILAAAPCVTDPANYMTIADFDSAICLSATTEYPEEAKAFLQYAFTKHGGEVVGRNMGAISTVVDAETEIDPALQNQLAFLESGKYCGYSEREWIPGIKEIMKKNVQDWMSGALTLEEALEAWNNEHLRLLEADPGFKDEFEEYRNAYLSVK